MLALRGIEATLRDIAILAKLSKRRDGPTTPSPDGIKTRYRDFLRGQQPAANVFGEGPTTYVTDPDHTRKLVAIFNQESRADDVNYRLDSSPDMTDGPRQFQNVKQARTDVAAAWPEFGVVFDLAINTVFHARCDIAAGGTTSAAIGALWVDARPDWTMADLREFLMHELTHTLLFVLECRTPLYTKPLATADDASFAKSAIRAQLRPMDKAFHSLVVAADLLLARDRFQDLCAPEGGRLHPASEQLRDGARDCLASIQGATDRTGILSEEALRLLHECGNALNRGQPDSSRAKPLIHV